MSEQKVGYFDKIKKHETFIKILSGIILALIISLLLVVKSLISVASNKTIVVQVPQFMESGNYIIGNTFASESVYKMWGKFFVQDIANFSYQNIRQKYGLDNYITDLVNFNCFIIIIYILVLRGVTYQGRFINTSLLNRGYK